MTERTALRIALIALMGAAMLAGGLFLARVDDHGWLAAFWGLPDVIYNTMLGATPDATFGNLDFLGHGINLAKVLVAFGRFLLPIALIYAAYQLARDQFIAWRAVARASVRAAM